MRLSLSAAAAASAALLMTPASPASAETSALVLICQFQYFGGRSLSGDCTTATGIPADGGAHVEATIDDSIALCPVTRTGWGHLYGTRGLTGFGVDFNWTRVSGAGVMTFGGSTTGVGTTVSTDPCAAMLTSEIVVMTIVGV